jgi:small subunit ribosomal protein S20
MPIKRSAMKALRQTVKKTERNRQVKEGLTYLRRMSRKALEAKDAKEAAALVSQIVKAVDKAMQHGIIKKNTGARIKSRLIKATRKVSAK